MIDDDDDVEIPGEVKVNNKRKIDDVDTGASSSSSSASAASTVNNTVIKRVKGNNTINNYYRLA